MKFSTDYNYTVLMFQEWRVTSITGKPVLTLIFKLSARQQCMLLNLHAVDLCHLICEVT